MLDEHCHIIWGVDDGADSWETSLRMLDAARACGIDRMVCTPHMRWRDFDQGLVRERFAQLQHVAPDMEMTLGYEVYYDRLLEVGLDQAPRFATQGTSSILVEFNSGGAVPDGWERVFYALQTRYGLDITLAHPERYSTVLANFDLVYRFADMGVRLQVSAGDLLRGRFDRTARCARRMVREGLCDALVSDAHEPAHYRAFAKACDRWLAQG